MKLVTRASRKLYPAEPNREAMYTLSQESLCGTYLNMVAWKWLPKSQNWQSLCDRKYTFSPEAMADSFWVIFEETTEDVYIVKDYFGQIHSRASQREDDLKVASRLNRATMSYRNARNR